MADLVDLVGNNRAFTWFFVVVVVGGFVGWVGVRGVLRGPAGRAHGAGGAWAEGVMG